MSDLPLRVSSQATKARAPEEGFWLETGFSTADIALAAQLDALRTPLTPRQATLVAARPHLARWLDRVDAAVRRGPRRVPVLAASLAPVVVDPSLHASC